MKVSSLIDCHHPPMPALDGVPQRLLYDDMKTVVLECEVDGSGNTASTQSFLTKPGPVASSSNAAAPIVPEPKARSIASTQICATRSTFP